MKRAILSFSALGGVAAQITAAPDFASAVVKRNLNTADPAFAICSDINAYLSGCIAANSGLQQTQISAIASCACCVSQTPLDSLYLECSDFVKGGAPTMTELINIYNTLYSVCMSETCTNDAVGGGSFTNPTSAAITGTPALSAMTASVTSAPASLNQSIGVTGLASTANYTSIPDGCVSLVETFASCTSNTPGFTSMPLSEQAECYCCPGPSSTWNNGVQTEASQCASWAQTADPQTYYRIALEFIGLCPSYKNVCRAQVTSNGAIGANGGTTAMTTTQENEGSATAAATTTSKTGSGAVLKINVGLACLAAFLLVALQNTLHPRYTVG